MSNMFGQFVLVDWEADSNSVILNYHNNVNKTL